PRQRGPARQRVPSRLRGAVHDADGQRRAGRHPPVVGQLGPEPSHLHPERHQRRVPGRDRGAVAGRPAQRHRAHRPGQGRPQRLWGVPVQRGAEPDPARDGRLLRLRQLPLAPLPVRLGERPPGQPLRRRRRAHRRRDPAGPDQADPASAGHGSDRRAGRDAQPGIAPAALAGRRLRPGGHFQAGGSELPSRKPIDGLQSGLVQTVVDNMALGRALKAGLDIPTVGTNLVDPTKIMYYGLSFGGIYGTMLMGTDPLFHQGLLNVPGGPIVDIARLSSFRGDLADKLAISRPSFLNGGPGRDGFTEDLPLRVDPPEVITHPGAAALQELFANTNWYDRKGSPETFAPRIRLRPDPAWASNPKNFVFQIAYADGTTTDVAGGTIVRAGAFFDRVVFYRNDKTPTYSTDPHGWLADPSLAGRT